MQHEESFSRDNFDAIRIFYIQDRGAEYDAFELTQGKHKLIVFRQDVVMIRCVNNGFSTPQVFYTDKFQFEYEKGIQLVNEVSIEVKHEIEIANIIADQFFGLSLFKGIYRMGVVYSGIRFPLGLKENNFCKIYLWRDDRFRRFEQVYFDDSLDWENL